MSNGVPALLDLSVSNSAVSSVSLVTFAQSPIKLACSDIGSTNLLIRQSDAYGVIPAPPTDKLWSAQLPTTNITPSPLQCNATRIHSDADFVSFGSPAYSIFINAVRKGYLNSWPRLTSTIVSAHPANTLAAAKGHPNQHRQGIDSTHQLFSPNDPPLVDTDFDTLSDDLVTPEYPTVWGLVPHLYL